MKLSVIVPVYNEIGTLAEIIRRIRAAPVQVPMEIIFVDDCSVDGTREFLQSLVTSEGSESMELKVFMHERNLGKGAAIRTAITHVTGTISSSKTPTGIRPARLWGAAQTHSRWSRRCRLRQPLPRWRPSRIVLLARRGQSILTTLCNMVTNLNLTDMEVGYKVFRAEILKQIQLQSSRFGFEPEITVKVAKLGCRIYEVPISYHGRTYAEGKKISWRDGIAALFHIMRYRFFVSS